MRTYTRTMSIYRRQADSNIKMSSIRTPNTNVCSVGLPGLIWKILSPNLSRKAVALWYRAWFDSINYCIQLYCESNSKYWFPYTSISPNIFCNDNSNKMAGDVFSNTRYLSIAFYPINMCKYIRTLYKHWCIVYNHWSCKIYPYHMTQLAPEICYLEREIS